MRREGKKLSPKKETPKTPKPKPTNHDIKDDSIQPLFIFLILQIGSGMIVTATEEIYKCTTINSAVFISSFKDS